MLDVPNVFDLVKTDAPPDAGARQTQVKRSCSYTTRWGTACPRNAMSDATVCDIHGGNKSSLAKLRKEAINLGPLVMETIEDLMQSENDLARASAIKLWMEFAGVKDMPPMGSGIEEEEMLAARTSLGRKLDAVAERVLARKTA
jgi:hypothetical protein